MAALTPAEIENLVERAVSASERAYAPYTKFTSGAAVLHENGDVSLGALVENVSLGLAMCAERVALHNAVTASSSPIRALALNAPGTRKDPTFPCGACCQVALELGGRDMVVIVTEPRSAEVHVVTTVNELLPNGPKIDRS